MRRRIAVVPAVPATYLTAHRSTSRRLVRVVPTLAAHHRCRYRAITILPVQIAWLRARHVYKVTTYCLAASDACAEARTAPMTTETFPSPRTSLIECKVGCSNTYPAFYFALAWRAQQLSW